MPILQETSFDETLYTQSILETQFGPNLAIVPN